MSIPSTVVKMQRIIRADNKLRELNANEFVFAVVGPVGSGTSSVAQTLEGTLRNPTYGMDVHIIKASDAITNWAQSKGHVLAAGSTYEKVTALQDAGDAMREADPAAVAIEIIAAIKSKRESLNAPTEGVTQLKPTTSSRRAYIIDSLKHPAEVELLRAIYQESFCLIGVVCEEAVREARLLDKKCRSTGRDGIQKLMKRDEDADVTYGQKVTDTFHLADFFVDNTPDQYEDKEEKVANKFWGVPDNLARLADMLTFGKVIKPTPSETGMFYAYGAKMRSACLSRQVGAALIDKKGNVISTGTNEVPRAGGGVYGGDFEDFDNPEIFNDHRCAATNKYCSSNRSQIEIIDQIIDAIPQLRAVENKIDLRKQLKKTPIGRLLEFSRAVHAEMDALLSATRTGATTVGSRLFVTTFPCHYCARHIVSAGVDEVQYIEPYPKSRALGLHGDAITGSIGGWRAPSKGIVLDEKGKVIQRPKVLFRPFTGVAPRLYRQVFLKDRKLKNDGGDFAIADSDSARGLLRVSYQDVESVILDRREE